MSTETGGGIPLREEKFVSDIERQKMGESIIEISVETLSWGAQLRCKLLKNIGVK